MEAFFETRCKTKTSAKQHLNVIKNISKKLDFNENGHEFISKFNEVKDLLDTYSATTRQKYATIIRMFIDYLNLKNDVHNEYVQKYNSIAARAQTPNPRPRPPKGPDTTVYVEEKVERKEPEQNKKVDRLSRKLATTLDEKTLTKIDTITPTFIDKKNKPIEECTKKQYKSSIKAIAKAYTPQQTNLNFLVTEPEKVINFLNNFNVSKRKAYYNAIVRYLPITDFPLKNRKKHMKYITIG